MSTLFAVITFVVIAWMIWKISKSFEKNLKWILWAGLATRMVFLLSVRPDEQTNDWHDHVNMIHLIANRGIFQKATTCFECYHPPLYHFLNANFLAPLSVLGGDLNYWLQWLQLGAFMLALVAFLDFLRKLITDKEVLFLSALLTVFWPRGMPLSCSINNDIGVCVCSALALSSMVTVGSEAQAAGYSVAGLLMKGNSILMYPILLGYEFYREKRANLKRTFVKLPLKMFGVMALGIVLVTSFEVYNRTAVSTKNIVVGNQDNVEPQFGVGTGFKNFACFQIYSFLHYPDLGVGDGNRGRQCFWNVLLKTSVVTEQDIPDPFHRYLARTLEFGLLCMILLGVGGGRNTLEAQS